MTENIEKAVFVGIITDKDEESRVMEYLDELEFLAETAGATRDKKFVQRLERPDNATYIRSGKLKEIAEYCEENEIKYVIFDDELSGTQQRNIEKIICCRDSRACGLTLSDREVAWVREEVWVKPRLRLTAVS